MQKFENEKCSAIFLLIKHDYSLNDQKVISLVQSKTAAIEERHQLVFDFLRKKNGDKMLKNEQMMEKFIIKKSADKSNLAPGYYVEVNPNKNFYKMTFCKKYNIDQEVRGMLFNSFITKSVWKKKFNINIVRCGKEQCFNIKKSLKKSKDFVNKEDLDFAQDLAKMFNKEIHQLPVFNDIRETLEAQRNICISELVKKYTEYFQSYSKTHDNTIITSVKNIHNSKKIIKLPPQPNSTRQIVVKDNTVSIHQKLAQEAMQVLAAMQARRAL